jgi:ribosomal protein S18 acetylase RimI-like enzyme
MLWSSVNLGWIAQDEWDALMSHQTAVVLVAEDVGRVVGSVIATYDGWRAYIYHLAVAEEERHHGVGHALFEEAEQYLEAAGARHVYVMVDAQNTDGLALAAAEGFSPEGDVVLGKRLAVHPAA